MRLSIGILSYNHEKYLVDCFKSIIANIEMDSQVVIIDDASSDASDVIIQEFIGRLKKHFSEVTYIHHISNIGNISKNVNEIISNMNGEYCYLISGDDMLCSGAINKMISVLDDNPEYDLIYANMITVEDSFRYGDELPQNRFVTDQNEGIQDKLFERLLYRDCIPAPAVIYRKNVFEKYGLHDETIFSEDYEYWLRISRTAKIYFFDIPLVLYRRSEKSVTVFNTDEGQNRLMRIMEANYQAKKKYISNVSEKYAKVCLREFYEKYYKECLELAFQNGIRWIENKMKEDDVFIDPRQADYRLISERLSQEADILFKWVRKKSCSSFLQLFFEKKNIKSIAIYGYSRLGKLLEEELKETNIELVCIVDRKGKALQASVPIIQELHELSNVDMLVVAPRGLYIDIKEKMSNSKIEVIDISLIVEGE